MNAEVFVQWMNHFIQHVKCSPDDPVLLLLDNHKSHVSVECLDLAKKSGVIKLSFPPHCSHKLQPLDRSVYGPLKRNYNAACDDWVVSNPRPYVMQWELSIVLMLKHSCHQTSPQALLWLELSRWIKTQIIDDEFLASSVTDRPELVVDTCQPLNAVNPITLPSSSVTVASGQSTVLSRQHPSHRLAALNQKQWTLTPTHLSVGNAIRPNDFDPEAHHMSSLEKLKPFPTAGLRKTIRGRQGQHTRILTNTPVRNELHV